MRGRGRGASRSKKVVPVPRMTPTRNSRRPAPDSGINLRPMVPGTATPRNDTPAGGSAKATGSSSDGREKSQLSFNLMANTASTASSGGGRVSTRAVPPRVATPAVPRGIATPAVPRGIATPAVPRGIATPAVPRRIATPAVPRRIATPAVPRRIATPAVPRRIATPAPVKRGSVAQPTSVISGGRPIAKTRTNDTDGSGRSTPQTAFRRTTVNSIAASIPGEAGGLVATPGVVSGTKRVVKNVGNVPSKKAKMATQGRTDKVGPGPSTANNQPGPRQRSDGSTHTEPQPPMAMGKRARGSVGSSAQRAPPPKSLAEIMAMPTSTSDTNEADAASSDDDDVVTVTASSATGQLQGQGNNSNSMQQLVGYDQNQMMAMHWDNPGRMVNSPMTMIYNAWEMPMRMGIPPMFGMGMMPYPYGFGFGGMYGMAPGMQLIPPSASMFVHRGMMNQSVGNANGMWSAPGFGQGSSFGNMGHMGMGMPQLQLPSPQNPGRHSRQH